MYKYKSTKVHSHDHPEMIITKDYIMYKYKSTKVHSHAVKGSLNTIPNQGSKHYYSRNTGIHLVMVIITLQWWTQKFEKEGQDEINACISELEIPITTPLLLTIFRMVAS